MKLILDQVAETLSIEEENGATRTLSLYSDEAFELIAHQYVRVGWNQKQVYSYSWMGRPVIQLPDDMVRMQEVIYRLRPDLLIETGIAHGGSLIFYASLMEAMHHGRVLGIDIEIRPHNRTAIEAHEMYSRIEMLEGSSVDPAIVSQAAKEAEDAETVLVILDSNHTYDHVMAELEAFAPLVTKGSYIVSTDGVMRDVVGVPRAGENWATDNPANAAEDFAAKHPEFVIEQPEWPFNESTLSENVTHYPSAWLKRI
ncbi:MAG: CmcI family methyltransferase [Pseudomonadota bacterium]